MKERLTQGLHIFQMMPKKAPQESESKDGMLMET
jgi:hypothetical protein